MPNTTIATLSKMVLSFDDERLESFYHNLSKSSPEFKAQCIDKMLSVFVKMEKLFEEHRMLELMHRKIERRRNEAEQRYQDWEQKNQDAKNLQKLIESDPKMNLVFKKLVELSTTNQFVGQESIDLLIQAEKTLDEKIATLHQEQVFLDKRYIQSSWQTHRRLSKVLREIAKRLPLKDIHQLESAIFDTASEKIVFDLSELFFASFKKTPTGYQYITLDEFVKIGIGTANEYFTVKSPSLVRAFSQEVFVELYHELADFYGTFQGTQQELDSTVNKREALSQELTEKITKLKELVGEYTGQLAHIAQISQEIEPPTDGAKIIRTPKPPPTLRPG